VLGLGRFPVFTCRVSKAEGGIFHPSSRKMICATDLARSSARNGYDLCAVTNFA
jgi:hypothetical protein